MASGQEKDVCHYYVDESGDGVLFDRRGRVVLDVPDTPKFFILGLLDVTEPDTLDHALGALREDLLQDPYFAGVPSMKKTARAFHAKDDLAEVRREVFRVLAEQDVRFSAVVKDMRAVHDYVRGHNAVHADYRYDPNEL